MKKLLLLRHAKSSWDDPSLDDFDRPLATRGREAAPLVGGELARRDWAPEMVLVSRAVRTRQTWELVAAELGAKAAVEFAEGLYEASPQALLAEIGRTPEGVGTLMLIGHNPGLEELAKLLAAKDSDPDALKRMREKFPTAALARFKFDGRWSDLEAGTAKLTHFLQPER
jgi:phosphohistidine phosphatase